MEATDEINHKNLGDQFKSEAANDLRQIVLEDWDGAIEHEDGTITAEGQLAFPARLFLSGRAVDGYNRKFLRVTPNKPVISDRQEFDEVWKGDENIDDYEKSYINAVEKAKASDEAYGRFKERYSGTTLGYSDGLLLELKDNDDFSLYKNDLSPDSEHTRLEKYDNGRLLSFYFGIRDLSVHVYYNSKERKGGIARISIGDGEGKYAKSHKDDERRRRLDMGFDGDDRIPYVRDPQTYDRKTEITDEIRKDLLGRPAIIQNGRDSVHFTVYKIDNPEEIDFEMDIPKKQECETLIDYKDRDVTRFKFEDQLIPEDLRRNPLQKPDGIDDAWVYADLQELLGVKIKKHNINS